MTLLETAKEDKNLEVVVEELLWGFEIWTTPTNEFVKYIINTLPYCILYKIIEWGATDERVINLLHDFIKEKTEK